MTGRLYASGDLGVPMCLARMPGESIDRVMYGDSKGAVVLLTASYNEMPARDLLFTGERRRTGRGGGWWERERESGKSERPLRSFSRQTRPNPQPSTLLNPQPLETSTLKTLNPPKPSTLNIIKP